MILCVWKTYIITENNIFTCLYFCFIENVISYIRVLSEASTAGKNFNFNIYMDGRTLWEAFSGESAVSDKFWLPLTCGISLHGVYSIDYEI